MSRPIALFLGTPSDKQYLPYLKPYFNGLTTFVSLDPFQYLTELEIYTTKRNITKVVSTNTSILAKLIELNGGDPKKASLSNYAGSLFKYKNLEIVFIDPLDQLFTVPYGKFIAARFISKVAAPESWNSATTFSWSILSPKTVEEFYVGLDHAIALATDIETFKVNLAIRCIGYTSVLVDSSGAIHTTSVVLPLTDEWALSWMRKINSHPIAKIFQNGKYDISYLLRYNAPPTNYLWDTKNLFHCHYAELPKDLAFLNVFHVRDVVYWKDLADTNDLHEYYKYNALDTWATANVWIQQMLAMPDWAKKNYLLEFPVVFPAILAEMTGIKRDPERHIKARAEALEEEEKELKSLRAMIGASGFNPSSSIQVKQLFKVLGCGDIPSTDKQDMAKAMYRHPLNARILGKIGIIRNKKKARTTYLRTDEDITKTSKRGAKEFHGRILYSLNPDGTETSRLASREHHFWCGLQIQNITTGPSVKQTICADDGFYLAECDLEQAESRDTAYISGDAGLISAVSSDRDFHSVNASAFFGKPYEAIYDQEHRKTKDKKLRDLSKRTNHGANYNMGPGVMVDTMGLENVWEAKRLLGLPFYLPEEICEYLLCKFHLTYPTLRGPIKVKNENVSAYLKLPPCPNKFYAPGTYYAWVAQEVSIHKRITTRAFHHTKYNLEHYTPESYIQEGDWTRYCFGNPTENKNDLNSYVAHAPQGLNARTLNEAFLRVFYEIALPNPETFRLHAQIHDSILFSYALGCDYLCAKVKECMEIPVTVLSIDGVYRQFTVPAALKLGRTVEGTIVPARYWSETE